MLRRNLSAAVCLSSIFLGGVALAEPPATQPDRADERPVRIAAIDPVIYSDAAPARPEADAPEAKKRWVKGYQVETGIATTSVSRGRPVYLGRYEASSQSTAAITLDRLGPGSLTLSAWNATALSRFGEQPGTAIQVDLSATYTLKLGKSVEAGVGYLVSLFPRKGADQPLDGLHEISASLTWDNALITPKLTVVGEVLRLKGVYASLSGAHVFELGPLSLTPLVSLGVAGYEETPLQLNDATLTMAARWVVNGPVYLELRGAFTYLCGPSSAMPEELRSPLGRSVPWGMLALGAQR